MRAYSNDPRERIVIAVERGEQSIRHIAHVFSVTLSCASRLLHHLRRTGPVPPTPHGGVPPRKLDAAAAARLLDRGRAQPDATLADRRGRLGIPWCRMPLARALQRPHITRKKEPRHAQAQESPRVQAQRQAVKKKLAPVGPAPRAFVDERAAPTPRQHVALAAAGSWVGGSDGRAE